MDDPKCDRCKRPKTPYAKPYNPEACYGGDRCEILVLKAALAAAQQEARAAALEERDGEVKALREALRDMLETQFRPSPAADRARALLEGK